CQRSHLLYRPKSVKIPLTCSIRLTAALARGASLLVLWPAGLALLGTFPSQAQPPVPSAPVAGPLAFEVASIKLTPPEFRGSRAFAPSSGNNLSLRGMSLR